MYDAGHEQLLPTTRLISDRNIQIINPKAILEWQFQQSLGNNCLPSNNEIESFPVC